MRDTINNVAADQGMHNSRSWRLAGVSYEVIAFVAIALVAAAAYAAPQNAPRQQAYVTDQAGILSASTKRSLTKAAQSHEASATNQVVVATVDTLEGWSIERYGRWLGNHWGVGQRGKNNGVLLLVAPTEREVRIEVGIGLENILINAIAKKIIDREIIPHFKQGHMEIGVTAGHQANLRTLEGKRVESPFWERLLIIAIFGVFVFFAVRDIRDGGFFGGGGGFSVGGGGGFGGGGASGKW